jgi:hypothetical protein
LSRSVTLISGETNFTPEAIGEIKITALTSVKFLCIAKCTEGADPRECPIKIISLECMFKILLAKKPTSSMSQ